MDGLPFWGSDINGVLIVKRQWPCHLSLPFVLLKLFHCAFLFLRLTMRVVRIVPPDTNNNASQSMR